MSAIHQVATSAGGKADTKSGPAGAAQLQTFHESVILRGMNARTNDPKAQSSASQKMATIIVLAIDDGSIVPSRWEVCRTLAKELPDCDGFRDEALRAAVNGSKDERARIAKELWRREAELPSWQGAKFRILVGLTNDDGPLDGYESEYLVDFANLSGVPCERIMSAFGLRNGG